MSVLAWGISVALVGPASGAPASSPAPGVSPAAVVPGTPAAAPTAAPVAPAAPGTPAAAPAPATPVAAAPAAATPVAAVPVTPAPAAAPSAAQLLANGRLLEAALEYEEAWRTSAQPDALLGAATAREAMGHRGHAAAYLRELAARGNGDATVTTRLAELERGLVPVKVVVTTPEAARDLVVLARYRGRAADARPDLVLRVAPTRSRTGEVTAPLDAGAWEVWLADEYYVEHRQTITVGATGVAPVVRLEPTPRDPAAAHARRMASPVLLLGVGIGLVAGGAVETRRALRRSDFECGASGWPCRDLMSRAISLRSAGAGLLGASAGMAAAHLVLISPSRRVRQAVWTTESALGLVGVIAGSIGVAVSARAYNSLDREALWSDPDFRAGLQRTTAGHTASAFFLGFGAGMLVRSVGYLISSNATLRRARWDRRERKGPIAVTPGAGGAVLSASF